MNVLNNTEKYVLVNLDLRFKKLTERTTKMNELQKRLSTWSRPFLNQFLGSIFLINRPKIALYKFHEYKYVLTNLVHAIFSQNFDEIYWFQHSFQSIKQQTFA